MSAKDEPTPRVNPFAALRAKLGDALPPGPQPPPGRTPPARRPAPRCDERVTVRHERTGRGGKTVTVAEGPGLAGAKLEELASEAARALGVGARVEARTLAVQGDQRERLAAWLEARGFTRVVRGN